MRNRGFGPTARQLTRCFGVPQDRVVPQAVSDEMVMTDTFGMGADPVPQSTLALADTLSAPVQPPESRIGYARIGYGEVSYNLDNVQRSDTLALGDALTPLLEPTPFESGLDASDTLDVETNAPESTVGAARVGYSEIA